MDEIKEFDHKCLNAESQAMRHVAALNELIRFQTKLIEGWQGRDKLREIFSRLLNLQGVCIYRWNDLIGARDLYSSLEYVFSFEYFFRGTESIVLLLKVLCESTVTLRSLQISGRNDGDRYGWARQHTSHSVDRLPIDYSQDEDLPRGAEGLRETIFMKSLGLLIDERSISHSFENLAFKDLDYPPKVQSLLKSHWAPVKRVLQRYSPTLRSLQISVVDDIGDTEITEFIKDLHFPVLQDLEFENLRYARPQDVLTFFEPHAKVLKHVSLDLDDTCGMSWTRVMESVRRYDFRKLNKFHLTIRNFSEDEDIHADLTSYLRKESNQPPLELQ